MATATIKHGPWGGPYTLEVATAARWSPPPRSGQTRSGYGKRMPTGFMILRGKRWYRVYMVCFSNSGTAYIEIAGVKTVVEVEL